MAITTVSRQYYSPGQKTPIGATSSELLPRIFSNTIPYDLTLKLLFYMMVETAW